MCPAALEIPSPINNNSKLSSFQNPKPNLIRNMEPCFSPPPPPPQPQPVFEFGFSGGSQKVSGRVRPRLVKLRKHLHGGRARGSSSGEVGSGFNPFASSSGMVSDGGCNGLLSSGFSLGGLDAIRVNYGNGVTNGNEGFVFGANGSDKAVNFNLVDRGIGSKDDHVEKKASPRVHSGFDDDKNDSWSNVNNAKNESGGAMGGSGLGSKLGKDDSGGDSGKPVCGDEEIQNGEGFHNVPAATSCSANGDRTWKEGIFVFGSNGKESSVKSSNEIKENVGVRNGTAETPSSKLYSDTSENRESPHRSHGDHTATSCGVEAAFKLPEGMKKLNINDIENVNDANTTESSKFNSKSTFVFSSSEKMNLQQNGAAAQSSSFVFTVHGLQQNSNVAEEWSSTHLENNKESSGTCTSKGSGSNEFQVPDWDPSSLKENLFPEVIMKPGSTRKSRLSRDKKSNKLKGKMKQSSHLKQDLPRDHVPRESDSLENPDSPGYYSPMDFSPYEDRTAADQLPSETPMVLSKPSHLDNGYASSRFASGLPLQESGLFGTEEQGQNCKLQFPFASIFEDEKAFTFSASTSSQGNLSLRKRQIQKKFGKKASANPLRKNLSASTLSSSDAVQSQKEANAQSKSGNKSEKGSTSTSVVSDACEMWRLRGNQAYRNGDLHKAEDYYTQGINSVPSSDNIPSSDNSGCHIKPLTLCYSNRAATRISLGRLKEALGDCEMAASLDPNFLKVYMRAANCHLVLGEFDKALQYFNKCFESDSSVCLDRRATIEAVEGVQKAQKVGECTNRATELLEKKTSEAAASALDIIAEALAISSCSEKLLQMKAEALFMVRQYKEVIELCEETLPIADKNSASAGSVDHFTQADDSGSKNQSPARLWRWHLISKSYFCMGKLEMALDLLQKLEQWGSTSDKHENKILESSNSLAATISELLQFKNAGNEAVKAGRYAEAVEHYTAALSRNVESRPFAAICFCNRAAANQALVQIADAIADCSLAMALDGNYKKAVSRRATLHEMIRDYGQAANDLRRLINLLEKQSEEKAKSRDSSCGPSIGMRELRQARQRLSKLEEEAKRGMSLDFYIILGVKTSDTAADIKKAYRKAALKHHPDKAGQFLVRSDTGDEGRLWKDIVDEVHKDADRLFKMIGEAYTVLSDSTKRTEYDLDEEMRKGRASGESNRSSERRRPSDVYGYPSQRSPNRRNWKENRKTYGSSDFWW